jgi:Asp-tRNA(Asn)/Glu-tRNA(Gln) amidotransferase A subunit family amidase
MMELYEHTIHDLHDMLKKGETTSHAVTESVLGRIKAVDSPGNLVAAHGGNLESVYLKLTGRSLAD